MASWVKETPDALGVGFSISRTAKFSVLEPSAKEATTATMNDSAVAAVEKLPERSLPKASSTPDVSGKGKKGNEKEKGGAGKGVQSKDGASSNGVGGKRGNAEAPAKRGGHDRSSTSTTATTTLLHLCNGWGQNFSTFPT